MKNKNGLRDDAHLFHRSRHKSAPGNQYSGAEEAATTIAQGDGWTAERGYNPYTQETSRRLSVDIGRWNIAVNQYGNDDQRVQVFVVDLKGDDEYYASIPLRDVDRFISEKTGLSDEAVKSLYAKG